MIVALYRHVLDRTHRGMGKTVPLACRYVVERVRRDIGPAVSSVSDYATNAARRGHRITLPYFHRALDVVRRSLAAITPAYCFVMESAGRGTRVSVALYRDVLDRMHRGAAKTIPLARRYVAESARRDIGAATSSISDYVTNAARWSVRVSVPAYRYVLNETDRVIRVTIPSACRNGIDSTGRGVRTAIYSARDYATPGFRYLSEGLDRGVRVTIPRFYRSVMDTLVWTVRISKPYAFRLLVIGVITLLVIPPLLVVLYQSFLTAPFLSSAARFGLDAYRIVFADNEFSSAFSTTLILAAGMTLIALPLGVTFAFLMLRTNVPGRHWLEPLIILPIVVPSVVLAFGYVAALGPVGILTTAFNEWTGVAAPWDAYSLPFLVVIAGLTHVPHVYLCVATALRGIGSEAEEAARAAGGKAWRVALGVSVPMVMPAILFAGSLVFLLGFELFGLPLVLGEPQGRFVLTTYLFKLSHKSAIAPFELMAVVAVIVVAIALQLAFMQQQLLTEAQHRVWVRDRSARSAPFKLRYWRWPALLIVTSWITVVVLVPLAGIVVRSLVDAGDESFALSRMLTLGHYRELLERPDVLRAVINTLGIGLLGGACAVTIYSAIALAVHRRPSGWAQAVAFVAMVPRAMPGLVAGLAVLWALLFFKPLGPLRETLISVWLAYTVVWLAYGVQRASGTLLRVDPQLEDIARTVGAAQARVKFDITLPLIRNGLLASWLLIFLVFVREYATGIYLLVPGTEVIGSLLVSLWEKGATDLIAPLSAVHMIIIGTGLFIANRLGVRLHG